MALELTDYEKHYLLTNPDVLLILMDMHDMQQDQADSMEAGCHGDELRREELRQYGAKLIEADPGISSDEVRRRFAEPTGYAAQRLARARAAAATLGVRVRGEGEGVAAAAGRLGSGGSRLLHGGADVSEDPISASNGDGGNCTSGVSASDGEPLPPPPASSKGKA